MNSSLNKTQSSFKRVALISRHYSPAIAETLSTLINYLQNLHVEAVLETDTAKMLTQKSLAVVAAEQLAQHSELLIVVGGDGSLLQASHIATQQNLPILGINRGRLGFLTDILPNHLDQVAKVLAGEYQEEERFLLTSHMHNHMDALNDIVLMRGDIARMLEFDIYINAQFMCKQRADGLIISTPTGSTAYALSGGGPILHPALNAIVLVPMFPHTLTSRPIVLDGDSIIEIAISPHNEALPILSHDGRHPVTVSAKERVNIRKKPTPLRLIHPLDYNYFQTLQSKLYWENSI